MQFLLDYVVAILVLLLLDVAVISLHKIESNYYNFKYFNFAITSNTKKRQQKKF